MSLTTNGRCRTMTIWPGSGRIVGFISSVLLLQDSAVPTPWSSQAPQTTQWLAAQQVGLRCRRARSSLLVTPTPSNGLELFGSHCVVLPTVVEVNVVRPRKLV